ncbi:hypothetical protein Gohar_026856, partial [Gossypium harknessii]|nr:hypothetical protein [Gossypium harknessii]
MNTLQEDSVVRHGVENIEIIARMSEDTQNREGDCQIASFDSNLPQDKYCDVAQLLLVKPNDALLKAMSDIRDGMGKASGDRHLALFAFAVYGLIVFPKALGYVNVELANFLFQIGKGVNPAPLLFIWMKSHFRCLYKHFHQVFVPSTRRIEEFLEILIRCRGHLWVSLIGIWGAINYFSLMVLSQYGYHQCVPTTASLNKKAREQERTWRRVSNEKTTKMEVLEEEIFRLTKELKTKKEQNKEVTKEYTELEECFITAEQMVERGYNETSGGGSNTLPKVYQAYEEEEEE